MVSRAIFLYWLVSGSMKTHSGAGRGNEKPLEAIWVFGVSGDFQEGDPQRHAAFLRGVKMSAICFLAVATEKWVSR
jgi:hypothetical protein